VNTRTEVTTKKDDRGTSAGTLCKLCNPYAFSSKTTLRRIYQNTKITQAINHSYFSLHRDQTTARIGFQSFIIRDDSTLEEFYMESSFIHFFGERQMENTGVLSSKA
jgi:hypothetical protein